MQPPRLHHRIPPYPVEERGGETQKGGTATRSGRLPLQAAVACLALLPVLAAGCGGGEESAAVAKAGAGAKARVTVEIADFKFAPRVVKVRRGGTVSFVNRDGAPHTAQTDLAPDADFDTGRLERGDRNAVRLERTGRFAYFCAYHRFMEGTVEVVE